MCCLFYLQGYARLIQVLPKPKKTHTKKLFYTNSEQCALTINMKGIYTLTGQSIYAAPNQTKKLLITKRKHARPGMTSQFILLVDEAGNREYCSSLYPTNTPNEYHIEYKKNRYKLIHKETSLTID
jgi:hypothetical protein